MLDSCSSKLYGEIRFPCVLYFGQSNNKFYGISAFFKHNFCLALVRKSSDPGEFNFFYISKIFEFSFNPRSKLDGHRGHDV